MSNCAVCHKPVKSGIVVHSECMELLQKTQQLGNKPLTIEEIRKMVWESVWIVTENLSEWCIIHSCHADDVLGGGVIMTRRTGEKRMYPYSDYGKTWLAYRRKPNDWISVKDRMPEPFVSVLVYMPMENPCPTVHEGFITSAGVWHSNLFDRYADEVTHWMPMPAPPGVE